MKVLQVNSTSNWGSTGKIAEGIGLEILKEGSDSYIAFGRYGNPSSSLSYRIGNRLNVYIHVLLSRLFDIHGRCSHYATKRFINYVEKVKPDIIHLHNIHGYYINYPLFFDFLKRKSIPVVWTLHDCWTFTGHCAYYTFVGCDKWKVLCRKCPQKDSYPTSIVDNSTTNFLMKKHHFCNVNNLTLVPVSEWLSGEIKNSFMGRYPIKVIHNGIDINQFYPITSNLKSDKVNILGVANIWENRKGLQDFYKLREILPKEYTITLIGLTAQQKNNLPKGIIGISRTDSIEELVEYYSNATLLFNPTYEDNFPTVNLEALACGTPVVTYNTGGSPEAIDSMTGVIVEPGDLLSVVKAIDNIVSNGKEYYKVNCRKRAVKYFDKTERFKEYIQLYNEILNR